VSVNVVDVPGGVVPESDGVELRADEVAEIIAEAPRISPMPRRARTETARSARHISCRPPIILTSSGRIPR
jgi:hypothetical protein